MANWYFGGTTTIFGASRNLIRSDTGSGASVACAWWPESFEGHTVTFALYTCTSSGALTLVNSASVAIPFEEVGGTASIVVSSPASIPAGGGFCVSINGTGFYSYPVPANGSSITAQTVQIPWYSGIDGDYGDHTLSTGASAASISTAAGSASFSGAVASESDSALTGGVKVPGSVALESDGGLQGIFPIVIVGEAAGESDTAPDGAVLPVYGYGVAGSPGSYYPAYMNLLDGTVIASNSSTTPSAADLYTSVGDFMNLTFANKSVDGNVTTLSTVVNGSGGVDLTIECVLTDVTPDDELRYSSTRVEWFISASSGTPACRIEPKLQSTSSTGTSFGNKRFNSTVAENDHQLYFHRLAGLNFTGGKMVSMCHGSLFQNYSGKPITSNRPVFTTANSCGLLLGSRSGQSATPIPVAPGRIRQYVYGVVSHQASTSWEFQKFATLGGYDAVITTKRPENMKFMAMVAAHLMWRLSSSPQCAVWSASSSPVYPEAWPGDGQCMAFGLGGEVLEGWVKRMTEEGCFMMSAQPIMASSWGPWLEQNTSLTSQFTGLSDPDGYRDYYANQLLPFPTSGVAQLSGAGVTCSGSSLPRIITATSADSIVGVPTVTPEGFGQVGQGRLDTVATKPNADLIFTLDVSGSGFAGQGEGIKVMVEEFDADGILNGVVRYGPLVKPGARTDSVFTFTTSSNCRFVRYSMKVVGTGVLNLYQPDVRWADWQDRFEVWMKGDGFPDAVHFPCIDVLPLFGGFTAWQRPQGIIAGAKLHMEPRGTWTAPHEKLYQDMVADVRAQRTEDGKFIRWGKYCSFSDTVTSGLAFEEIWSMRVLYATSIFTDEEYRVLYENFPRKAADGRGAEYRIASMVTNFDGTSSVFGGYHEEVGGQPGTYQGGGAWLRFCSKYYELALYHNVPGAFNEYQKALANEVSDSVDGSPTAAYSYTGFEEDHHNGGYGWNALALAFVPPYLSGDAANGSIAFSWNIYGLDDFVRYELVRSSTPGITAEDGSNPGTVVFSSTSYDDFETSYSPPDLAKYYYRLRVIRSGGAFALLSSEAGISSPIVVSFASDQLRVVLVTEYAASDSVRQTTSYQPVGSDTLRFVASADTVTPDTVRRTAITTSSATDTSRLVANVVTAISDTLRRMAVSITAVPDTLRRTRQSASFTADTSRRTNRALQFVLDTERIIVSIASQLFRADTVRNVTNSASVSSDTKRSTTAVVDVPSDTLRAIVTGVVDIIALDTVRVLQVLTAALTDTARRLITPVILGSDTQRNITDRDPTASDVIWSSDSDRKAGWTRHDDREAPFDSDADSVPTWQR